MSFRTIELKLHNLSSYKKQVIMEAIHNYSGALQFLLDRAYPEVGTIRNLGLASNGKFSYKSIAKWVKQELSEELNQFNIEPMKDAIKNDFGSIMAGYFAMEHTGKIISFPRVSTYKYGHPGQHTHSLNFCRYSTRRDYCLLYDTHKNRYYAKLYIMNSKNKNRKIMESGSCSKLIYIYDGKPQFTTKGKKEQFILVPLECGKYQEEFLKQSLDNPGIFKSAHIYERKGDFFLSINLEVNQPKLKQAESYLGVYYGHDNLLSYAVTDKTSNIVKKLGDIHINSTSVPGKENFIIPRDINRAANELVHIARQNLSQLVVENPVFCRSSDIHKNRWSLYKLLDALDYRLEYAGLPKSIRVKFDSNRTECSVCGSISDYPTMVQSIFLCQSCGYAINIQWNAAVNLTKKVIKYSSRPLKVSAGVSGQKFLLQCKLLDIEISSSGIEQCYTEFWLQLKFFENKYFENLEENLKSPKWKKFYNIAKSIQKAKDLFDIVEFI